MQKVVNSIALLSGLVSLSVVGGGAWLYLHKNTLVEDARAQVTKAVTAAVTEALPGMLDSAMPEMPSMPKTTGPALPF